MLYIGVRGRPALGGDGKPTYGTISSEITFLKVGGFPRYQLTCSWLSTASRPGGSLREAVRSLIIDPTGKVLTCRTMLYGRTSPDALDRALCKVAATPSPSKQS